MKYKVYSNERKIAEFSDSVYAFNFINNASGDNQFFTIHARVDGKQQVVFEFYSGSIHTLSWDKFADHMDTNFWGWWESMTGEG